MHFFSRQNTIVINDISMREEIRMAMVRLGSASSYLICFSLYSDSRKAVILKVSCSGLFASRFCYYFLNVFRHLVTFELMPCKHFVRLSCLRFRLNFSRQTKRAWRRLISQLLFGSPNPIFIFNSLYMILLSAIHSCTFSLYYYGLELFDTRCFQVLSKSE